MTNSIQRKFWRSVEIAGAMKSSALTGRCFHITVVFDKNKIISIGANSYCKTHPKAAIFQKEEIVDRNRYVPGIHSELSAILKLGEDCSKFTFFNVRIDNNNQINNSRPCSGCTKLLKQVGFKRFYYSISGNSIREFMG